jgi:anaerobic selenocysteine-containing dehydrogenase
MTEVHDTFCRICIAACGMKVTVDGDQVVSIRGDRDHPLTRGYLCVKGRALGDFHASPGRLSGAYLGRGADRRAVTIDEAHADLADVLGRVVAEHGLGSVGVFHGTGAFQDGLGTWTARRFKRALGTDQLYSTATVDAVAKTLVAEQMAGTPLVIPNIDEDLGRLLVFVGINPVVSHGHATMFSNPVERLREARRRGRVITLDPRSTETARLSDQHLAVRPGTDYAVFAHTLRELLAGDIDEAALAERATGVDGLRAAVAGFDAPTTSALTGLGTDELHAFVAAVREAGRLAVLSGTGSTMPRSGNVTEWLSWALLVVTDSFDEPGGMWFNPGYFARLDRFDMLPRAAASTPSPPSRPDVARCGGEWPAALISDEIESGRLRALVILGSNLVTAIPEPARMTEALGSIDVLVTLDVLHNATTDLATHAFACAGQLERADVLGLELNANAVYQHYTAPVFPPRADRPPMWQTIGRIAAGIGLDALGGGADPMEATSDELLERMAYGNSLDDLRAAGGLRVDSGPRYGWLRQRLPNGRWDLAPAVLVAQLTEVQTITGLQMTSRRMVKRMNCQVFRDDERSEALVHPADAEAAGLADGDTVVISTATGSIRLPVRATDGVLPGTVSVVHGFEDVNVNGLIDRHDLDLLTGMARLSAVPVTMAKA